VETLGKQLEEERERVRIYEAGKCLIGVKIEIEGGFTPEEIAEIQAELALERTAIAEERKSMQQQAAELSSSMASQATQIDTLQQLLTSAQSNAVSLNTEIATLKGDKAALEGTIRRLGEELKTFEEQLNAQKQLCAVLDVDLQSALKDRDMRRAEIDAVSKCLEEAESGKNTLQGILDRTREELASRTKSLDTAKQQLQSVMSSRKLNAEVTFRLIQEGNGVLGMLPQPSADTLSFEEVLEGLKAHNTRLKSLQNELDSGLNKVIEKFGSTAKPSTDLSGASGKLIHLMEISLARLNDLQSKSTSAEQLSQASQQEISDLQKLVEELNRSAENYAKSADQSDKGNKDLRAQMQAREEEYQQLLKVAIEKSELEATVKALQTQAKEQSARLATEREMQQTLLEEIASLKVLLERAISEAKEKTEAGLMLQADKDQMSAELDSSRMSLATLGHQMRELEERKKRLEAAMESMQETEAALGASNEELTSHLSELEVALDAKEAEIRTNQEAITALESTCNQLRNELFSKEEQLSAANITLETNLKATETVKEEAKQLLSQVSCQVTSAENLIDRRFISTFLFNYLNPRNSERLRREMLESMVNVLGLSEDQRSTLGLGPDTGLLADFASFISQED
jgi:chromosome segregation ATPase